jgi:16S rRNA (cytosine967-C5)-methyltransferase
MTADPQAASARALALRLLNRVDETDSYVHLLIPAALDRSGLEVADRRLVTELVAGTTRMRRACDALVDRFIVDQPDARTRNLLRLGTYQLAMTRIPTHAAVNETVALAPRRVRGFVNAVLRRIATEPMQWPDEATRLSYPDWIVHRLTEELGPTEAIATLETMNQAPVASVRPDGYVQDLGSQHVVDAVGAVAGELIGDMCAAPGGKATALASSGAQVVAVDVRASRAAVVAENAARFVSGPGSLSVVVADAVRAPLRDAVFDAVLVDAPCSGLGVLRRRPDARWRITSDAIDQLAVLQSELLHEAARLVRPGGRLVYSVCTLTAAESLDHRVPAGFVVDSEPPDQPWRQRGAGWMLLPHLTNTDGMMMIRYRRVEP